MIHKLNSWYIAGLFNADGGFSFHYVYNKKSRFKYQIVPVVSLTQHENSKNVLELVKLHFNDGQVIKQNQNCFQYVLKNKKIILEKIIPFFDKYKLVNFKSTQYIIWKTLIFLMEEKFHLSSNGFYNFTSIILLINKFPKRKRKLENILILHEKNANNNTCCKIIYSNKLKKLLNLFLLKESYNVSSKKLHNYFAVGLIDGDGGFCLSFRKSIKPSFYFSQEGKSTFIFFLLQDFFNGGKIYKISNNYHRFIISDKKTLCEKVIPFFNKYNLQTEKKNYFEIFKKVIYELNKKNNLYKPENSELLKLAYAMNFNGKRRRINT